MFLVFAGGPILVPAHRCPWIVPFVAGGSNGGTSSLCWVADDAGRCTRSITRTAAQVGMASKQLLSTQDKGTGIRGFRGDRKWIVLAKGINACRCPLANCAGQGPSVTIILQ